MSERALYRSDIDRMLGGVCGGIAEYLDLDPTIVRLLAVLLVLVGNVAAVIVYIVMWIAVPAKPVVGVAQGGDTTMTEDNGATSARMPGPDAPPPPPPAYVTQPTASPPSAGHHAAPGHYTHQPAPSARRRGGAWFGAALIFVGVALLVQMFVPSVRLWEYWPVVIIVAGVLMIVRAKGGEAR